MQDIKPVILMLLAFTVICGGIYPAVVTGIAQALFPVQANGSLMRDTSGQVAGSRLIGQPFTDPKYFWPRPSLTADFAYNPASSRGSNAGPTNPVYLESLAGRIRQLHAVGLTGPLPADLVQASASGLDPHITPEAALVQIPRVVKERGLSGGELKKLVDAHSEDRQVGIFGNRRVNVLALNLALDRLAP
ncbi:MAG: potassium-transporting ATPase subunit KdpC [Geobacteraceae bacterium]